MQFLYTFWKVLEAFNVASNQLIVTPFGPFSCLIEQQQRTFERNLEAHFLGLVCFYARFDDMFSVKVFLCDPENSRSFLSISKIDAFHTLLAGLEANLKAARNNPEFTRAQLLV